VAKNPTIRKELLLEDIPVDVFLRRKEKQPAKALYYFKALQATKKGLSRNGLTP